MKITFLAAMLILSVVNLFADYAGNYLAAERLISQGSNEEARVAFEELAAVTPEPRSQGQCLSLAIQALIRQKKYDEAMKLADKIKDRFIAVNCRMTVLLEKNAAKELITAFADENISQWPEYLNHHGFFKRGRAYYLAHDSEKAAADLTKAIELAGCNRIMKAEAFMFLANMAGDSDKKLDYGLKILDLKKVSYVYMEAIMWVADIYIKKNQFDEAEKILRMMNPAIGGYWKFRLLARYGDLEFARGNKAKAKEYYEQALKIDHPYKIFIEQVKKQLEEMK